MPARSRVEWDSRPISATGCVIYLAPGSDWRFDDIRTAGAVTLSLDDGAAVLTPIEAPKQQDICGCCPRYSGSSSYAGER